MTAFSINLLSLIFSEWREMALLGQHTLFSDNKENPLLEATLDGCILDVYDLPGTTQEGITMYGPHLYLAQNIQSCT
ncbi:MAG: hypothetical protein KAJ73_09425 [Zetaproteobacteria bacterium]|nr:hypothetical protein [Zetaproteobacteria bacterium]